MSGEIVERVVRYVVSEIVDETDSVEIALVERGPEEVAAEVKTAREEMGRVIGRGGRVARAIRAVAQAAAEEEGLIARVDFVD